MATAEELLNALVVEEEEPHIIVNRDRTVDVPEQLKRIAVQYDHDVETVTIDCPRFWDDHDLSILQFYVNYRTPDNHYDSYPVEKVYVYGDNTDVLHFSWTISRNVTSVPGKISFLVCARDTDINGNEILHWNSELNEQMYISEGMDCCEPVISQNADVITHILTRLGMGGLGELYGDHVSPETFGAVGDGITDDSEAFIKAIMTGRRVVCDSTKTYYFQNPVDVRTLCRGHLDGNGAHFVNFHIYINLNDEFNDWRRSYPSDRFVIENANFGLRDEDGLWTKQAVGWETPVITTGAPMIIRNITTSYPYVLATVDEYIDYMLCDSWSSIINSDLYADCHFTLDTISCLNKDGQYCRFDNTTTNASCGDAWIIRQCNEFSSRRFPNYKMMHVARRCPLVVESCVQSSFDIGIYAKVTFNGCHWEDRSGVSFSTDYQNNTTFINCYFYNNCVLNNSRTTIYQNCFFRAINDSVDDRYTMADITGDVSLYDLKCRLMNCSFGDVTVIDSQVLNSIKYAPKKTYNEQSIAYRNELNTLSFTVTQGSANGAFYPMTGDYTYEIGLRATSLPYTLVDYATLTASIDHVKQFTRLSIGPASGGFSLVIIRTDPNGVMSMSEYYENPNELSNPNDFISIAFYDYGSYAYFGTGGHSSPVPSPWITIDEKPTFVVNKTLYEANGVLVTTDDSKPSVGVNGSVLVSRKPIEADNELSVTSENPIQNNVVTSEISKLYGTIKKLRIRLAEYTTPIKGAKWSSDSIYQTDVNTGEIVSGYNYVTENLIPVESGSYVLYDDAGDFTSKSVCLYRSDSTFIRKVWLDASGDALYFDVVDFENAAYVRLSGHTESDVLPAETMKLEKIGVWSAYNYYDVNPDSGVVTVDDVYHSAITLDFIHVESGVTYVHKSLNSDVQFNYKGVLEYDEDKKFIKFTSGGNTTDDHIITVTDRTAYVRLTASHADLGVVPLYANAHLTNDNLVFEKV